MLTPRELHALADELAGTKVLTVYHDARVTDPAMRHAWRPALTAPLRSARDAVADDAQRSDFDRAAAYLDEPLPSLDGAWGAPGWVTFLTPDGARYGARLPVRPSTLAAWRYGPVIAPYLRALKQQRAVVVALVDSRSARLYRYARGVLTTLPGLSSAAAEQSDVAASPADRHPQATAPRWAQLAGDALPAPLAARTMVSRTLDHDASVPVIEAAARRAASSLRATYGRALVRRLAERAGAGAGGRAAHSLCSAAARIIRVWPPGGGPRHRSMFVGGVNGWTAARTGSACTARRGRISSAGSRPRRACRAN